MNSNSNHEGFWFVWPQKYIAYYMKVNYNYIQISSARYDWISTLIKFYIQRERSPIFMSFIKSLGSTDWYLTNTIVFPENEDKMHVTFRRDWNFVCTYYFVSRSFRNYSVLLSRISNDDSESNRCWIHFYIQYIFGFNAILTK